MEVCSPVGVIKVIIIGFVDERVTNMDSFDAYRNHRHQHYHHPNPRGC